MTPGNETNNLRNKQELALDSGSLDVGTKYLKSFAGGRFKAKLMTLLK